MNRYRVSIALTLIAFACGEVTTLGGEKGKGGNGGAAADAGPDASTGGDAGTAGDATVSNDSGAGGSAAIGGSGGSGASPIGDSAPPPCNASPAPPIQNPTPEQQERLALIHGYCTNVMQQCPYLSWIHASGKCSEAELVLGCEQDTLLSYLNGYASCDTEWKSAVACAASAKYDPNSSQCSTAAIGSFGSGKVCSAEHTALQACMEANGTVSSVTGTKAECTYGPGPFGDCVVVCPVGANTFVLTCDSQPGLPLGCDCTVNGNFLNAGNDFCGVGNFYATDCADAAKRAANGQCTNTLDCCFEYNDGKSDICTCCSNPKAWNMSSCQGFADFSGGQVVEICPQYKFQPGTGCWPPGACS